MSELKFHVGELNEFRVGNSAKCYDDIALRAKDVHRRRLTQLESSHIHAAKCYVKQRF